MHDTTRLSDETLKVFLDDCLAANIPLRTVMENLLRNMRFLGHKPKYTYTDKEKLLQTFAKHALYANSDKREEKKYCTQILKREYDHIYHNREARDAKRFQGF